MRTPLRILAAVLLAAAIPASAAGKDAGATSAAKAKPTLLFFMNPAGRPCQEQDRLLAEGRAKWEPLAALRYVRTDAAADREAFYAYGVHALPSLILVGPDGREITRYAPGIQPVETILSGIPGKSAR